MAYPLPILSRYAEALQEQEVLFPADTYAYNGPLQLPHTWQLATSSYPPATPKPQPTITMSPR